MFIIEGEILFGVPDSQNFSRMLNNNESFARSHLHWQARWFFLLFTNKLDKVTILVTEYDTGAHVK